MKYLFGALLLLYFSCSKEPQKKGFKIRTHSELAILMMEMENGNREVRERLIKGEKIKKLPFNYNELLTSKPTFSSDVDSVFIHYAHNYIRVANNFLKSKDQKKEYNKLVDACIQCHLNKCGGPIVRIKKLYLKDENNSPKKF